MEDMSPGLYNFVWNKVLVSLMIALLGSTALVGVDAKRHRRRHNRYQSDMYHSGQAFYGDEMDYEDDSKVHEPEFLSTKSNISVVEGKMATLPCAVKYLGTKKVTWRRLGDQNDHFLTVGDFTWVRENNILVDYKAEEGRITHWNLVIKSVKKSDEGTYQCSVTETYPIRTHVYLKVKTRPETEPAVTISGEKFVDRNQKIRLQCNATGGPRIPDEIDWFKDGIKIDPSNPKFKDVQMTKYRALEHQALISELIIAKTDESDTGTYICRSSDRKIVSRKVTVLSADTTNVKRGTASKGDVAYSGDDLYNTGSGDIVNYGHRQASGKSKSGRNVGQLKNSHNSVSSNLSENRNNLVHYLCSTVVILLVSSLIK